jgi:hypothetical protein
MKTIAGTLTMLLLSLPGIAIAQLKFADSSQIRDPIWLERKVKYITDEELFSSMRLDCDELAEVREIAEEHKQYWKAYEAWGKYWEKKDQPKFLTVDFVEPYENVLSYYRDNPQDRENVLMSAERTVDHNIRGWGETAFQFGPIVDFNADYGKSGKYGFHYWGFGQALNVAYLLTNDRKYFRSFDELLNQWYEQRYRVTGGWAQEAGLDVVFYELGLARNRVFLEHYFFADSDRSWQTHERILKTMLGSARWLYELEKHEGYRPGNWQTVGSCTLVLIGLAFPEFHESSSWVKIGLSRLSEHLEKDFFADGGHSERSPYMYTVLTYSQLRNVVNLLKVYDTNSKSREQFVSLLGRTIDWWIAMMTPQGEISAFNDAHRGRIPARILTDGGILFGRKSVYGVLNNLYGTNYSAAVLPLYTSINLSESGFAVMRSDWSQDALYMVTNYGPVGGGHTHSDFLDFEMCAFGKALAIDAGIGLTYDDPLQDTWYRTSKAHNMLVVSDTDIDRQETRATNVMWSSLSHLDYFAAEHNGYLKQGVFHRRHVIFIKPFYFLILDDVKSDREGLTLSWYLHSPTELEEKSNGFQSRDSVGCRIISAPKPFGTRSGKGFAAFSREYQFGKNLQIDWIAFDHKSVRGEQRLGVLLYPFDHLHSTDAGEESKVELQNPSKTHYIIKIGNLADHIYLANESYDDGDVSTNAVLLWVRFKDGSPVLYSMVQGSYLKVGGKTVLSGERKSDAEGQIK